MLSLGFTEITIAALIWHAKESVTSKYVHAVNSTQIMARDTVSGYGEGPLEGGEFRRNIYTPDRKSRKNSIELVLMGSSLMVWMPAGEADPFQTEDCLTPATPEARSMFLALLHLSTSTPKPYQLASQV